MKNLDLFVAIVFIGLLLIGNLIFFANRNNQFRTQCTARGGFAVAGVNGGLGCVELKP